MRINHSVCTYDIIGYHNNIVDFYCLNIQKSNEITVYTIITQTTINILHVQVLCFFYVVGCLQNAYQAYQEIDQENFQLKLNASMGNSWNRFHTEIGQTIFLFLIKNLYYRHSHSLLTQENIYGIQTDVDRNKLLRNTIAIKYTNILQTN